MLVFLSVINKDNQSSAWSPGLSLVVADRYRACQVPVMCAGQLAVITVASYIERVIKSFVEHIVVVVDTATVWCA